MGLVAHQTILWLYQNYKCDQIPLRHICIVLQYGMFALELSSIELEIPNDAYTTLNQNLIGGSTLSQKCCNLIGWYWKIMKSNFEH